MKVALISHTGKLLQREDDDNPISHREPYGLYTFLSHGRYVFLEDRDCDILLCTLAGDGYWVHIQETLVLVLCKHYGREEGLQ